MLFLFANIPIISEQMIASWLGMRVNILAVTSGNLFCSKDTSKKRLQILML